MGRSSPSLWMAGALALHLAVAHVGVGQDSALRSGLAKLAEKAAVELTKAREFRVSSQRPEFVGTIRVVEPAQNTKITIEKFSFKNDIAMIELKVATRVKIKGELVLEGERIALDVVADAEGVLSGRSELQAQGENFVVKSVLSEADATITVQELVEPSDLQGGKKFASAALTMVLQARKDDILKKVNEHVAERKL